MEFPTAPQAITADWLTYALRKNGVIETASVKSFHTEAIGIGKGILGRLVRLVLDYDRNEECAPHSLIAKFPVANPVVKAFCTRSRRFEREIQFYQEIAGKSELRTPHCYFGAIDLETGDFALLLEDLAPARNGDWAAGCSLEEAALAVREIATFHAQWWESPTLAKMDWVPHLEAAPAVALNYYTSGWGPFLDRVAKHRFPDALLETGEKLAKHLELVLTYLRKAPLTIVHYDYHPDNLFFGAVEDSVPFAVVDWQTYMLGRGVHDVARLLGGSLPSEERRASEMDLLAMYHTLLVRGGIEGYPFDQCLYDYRFSMLDCMFRIVINVGGDSASRTPEQEQGLIEGIMPRYITAVLDLQAGDLLPA
jgi:hypothetical protein